nr:orotidine-5'-phosphate decarboxylase [Salinimonas chungwhensis]
MSSVDPKIIVALDYDNKDKALAFVDKINPQMCRLKVGKEMFTLFGPEFVRDLVDRQFEVFLDLKFHDIPNTVAKACKAAAELGVWMVNVHASGGKPMMEAALKAVRGSSHPQTKLIAVTVLTSMDNAQMEQINGNVSVAEQVGRLASLTVESGLDGIVCSAKEAESLRKVIPAGFLLVTPGIRPHGSDTGDQKRVMTPADAIAAGVDYLVMGRPITQASNPLDVLQQVTDSLEK